ncbi:SAM-dependent methyltransferase, partial [OCS116 cluster bacterium]|nr:SAM-dependent methyltransferase [OCS116 cluster bacterium]
MEKIKSILTKEIVKKGYISISRFMEISLTDPEEGYYINKKPLGKNGDFITAPDISQIFGEVIGAWANDIINKINSKSPFQIIDLGGGRGTLLKDIKRVRSDNSISYGFLEINKNLM